MIPGWISDRDQRPMVEKPLPEPHRVYYRDGAMVTPVAGAGSGIVHTAGGASAEVRAGLDAEGNAVIEAEIRIEAVFHTLLVDAIELDFRWRACGERPDTAWEDC